jgi:hypothetical protein
VHDASTDKTVDGQSLPPLSREVRLAHLLTLIAAGGFLLYESTMQWFYLDEWDFLGFRGIRLGNNGIFDPHNEHWTTIPIVIWRGLFNLVGVRHYWIYAIPMVVAHLAVVHLLWRLMLRHGVDPWTATLLVAAFAVLGVGEENLTRAFQLTFVGSVAFGLLAIESVERKRQRLPAIWGICAIMCSNIGVPMVLGCALVAVVRRRFAAAAWAALPPAVVFLIWYALTGHNGTYTSTDIASLSIGGIASYVWTGFTTSMGGLFDSSPHLGAVIVSVLAGAAVARRNVPAALVCTAVVLYIFVGFGRLQYGVSQATASRYSYIAVALCLPLIGQLITMLVKRHDLRPIVLSGLVVLIGVNAVVFEADAITSAKPIRGQEAQIEAAAYLIHKGETFSGQRTSSGAIGAPDMPVVDVLTKLVKHGQFPVPATVDQRVLRSERAILGVSSSRSPLYRSLSASAATGISNCIPVTPRRPAAVNLAASVSLRLRIAHPQSYQTATVTFLGVASAPTTYVVMPISPSDHWLNITAGTYRAVFVRASLDARICGASGSTARQAP